MASDTETGYPMPPATSPVRPEAPPIDRKFIIERQGKPMVLYAGLLHQAHLEGLSMISTRLIQVPDENNGLTAICSAVVRTRYGEFSGIGDASPNNVSRMMLPATIRMAETRAKARALRDACDIGMVAVEEIGPDGPAGDDEDGFRQARSQETPRAPQAPREDLREARPPMQNRAASTGNPLSEKQKGAIYSFAKRNHNLSSDEIEAYARKLQGKEIEDLTSKEASDLIGRFNDTRPLPALTNEDLF
jgi:hypothetical protein